MLHVLPRLKQRDVKLGILMDGDRVVFSIRAGDQSQLAPLLFCRKLLLLIARLDAAVLGQNPNLEQMGRIRLGGILLTVANPGSRAHTLSITCTNYRAVSHAVFLFEIAFKHIGYVLHIAISMCRRTVTWLYPV